MPGAKPVPFLSSKPRRPPSPACAGPASKIAIAVAATGATNALFASKIVPSSVAPHLARPRPSVSSDRARPVAASRRRRARPPRRAIPAPRISTHRSRVPSRVERVRAPRVRAPRDARVDDARARKREHVCSNARRASERCRTRARVRRRRVREIAALTSSRFSATVFGAQLATTIIYNNLHAFLPFDLGNGADI